MKRKIIKLQILILLLCFASINSYSQVNMKRFIEFKCQRGKMVSITIASDIMNTEALIKSGNWGVPVTMPTRLSDARGYDYYITDTILRIYGNVTNIMIRDSEGYISDINLDSNTNLIEIWASVVWDLHSHTQLL